MGSPSRSYKKHKHERRSHSRERHRDHRRRSPSLDYKHHGTSSKGYREERRHRSRSRSPLDRARDLRKEQFSRLQQNNSQPSVKVNSDDAEQMSREEREMRKLMGFSSFDTTKGKKVDGNDVGQVHVILKRKYRQYMNRKGGFNRPLDFVA